MLKIAYIGAGSRKFTTGLVTDILAYPALRKNLLISLMDINETRLNYTLKELLMLKESHPSAAG